LHYNFEKATKLTIPAVRIAVAITLSHDNQVTEAQIAKGLGIAQAAVSKYLTGNYSPDLEKLIDYIRQKKLERATVAAILAKKSDDEVSSSIEKAATEQNLIKLAL
jgi:predicted transcriptional regulator